MSEKMFSDSALARMGWAKAKEHIGTYILATFVGGIAVIIPAVIIMIIGGAIEQEEIFALLAFLSYIAMGSVIGAGFVRLFLNAVDGKEVSIKVLFSETKRALPYLLVTVLYGLIVMLGLVLFIIPGIIWSLKYILAPMLVVDQGMKPMEALRASAQMTDGIKWDIYGFQQVLGTILMLGYLVFFIGILVSIPVAMIAYMGLYRHLSPMKSGTGQLPTASSVTA